MLANFNGLFVNSLLPYSDQNFRFGDDDNIGVLGMGVLVIENVPWWIKFLY